MTERDALLALLAGLAAIKDSPYDDMPRLVFMELDRYGQLIEPERAILQGGPIIPPMPEDYMLGRHKDWPDVLRSFLRLHPDCLGCGRKATTAHHIVPYHVDPSLELELDNLASVCLPCHFVICHLGRWGLHLLRLDLEWHLDNHRRLVIKAGG